MYFQYYVFFEVYFGVYLKVLVDEVYIVGFIVFYQVIDNLFFYWKIYFSLFLMNRLKYLMKG